MPEHVHLLMNEPQRSTLAQALKSLKQGVARRLALWAEEPFWQECYYDFNVWSERKFREKLRYLHRNPVRRGLVAKPEDWPWSSFRHYATGEMGTVEIESRWTARTRERAGIFLSALCGRWQKNPAQAELERGTLGFGKDTIVQATRHLCSAIFIRGGGGARLRDRRRRDRAAVAAAAEEEAGASAGGVERNDVPGVLGDDVGGDEMDFAGEVGDGASVDAAMGVDAVETFEELRRTLHLDAPERRGDIGWEGAWGGGLLTVGMLSGAPVFIFIFIFAAGAGGQEWPAGRILRTRVGKDFAGVDDDVITFAVAVGTGDTEAEVGRLESESQFGEFSAALGVEFALAGSLGDGVRG